MAAHGQVLVCLDGRGHTGKTTIADFLMQRAVAGKRKVRAFDGNRNSTLAERHRSLVRVPPSEDSGDLKDALSAELSAMVRDGNSLIVDLGGGGDRLMQEYGNELNLMRFCERRHIIPLSIFMVGPDMEDFDHFLKLVRARYFVSTPAIVGLNSGVSKNRRSAAAAFDAIRARPECQEDGELDLLGIQPLNIWPLVSIDTWKRSGLSYLDALAEKPGRDGKPMDAVAIEQLSQWVDDLETGFIDLGIADRLP